MFLGRPSIDSPCGLSSVGNDERHQQERVYLLKCFETHALLCPVCDAHRSGQAIAIGAFS